MKLPDALPLGVGLSNGSSKCGVAVSSLLCSGSRESSSNSCLLLRDGMFWEKSLCKGFVSTYAMLVSHVTFQRNSEGVSLYNTALLWDKPFNNQSHLAMATQIPMSFLWGHHALRIPATPLSAIVFMEHLPPPHVCLWLWGWEQPSPSLFLNLDWFNKKTNRMASMGVPGCYKGSGS